jgi:hypothetical protein
VTSASATATSTAVPEQRLLGDVDGNGTVTINDALEVLKFLAKLTNELEKGEVNYKNALLTGGEVPNINDALEMLKYLAKLESKAGVWVTD